ncbi:MAG TPA: esterase-like activity of phytase family protein, partial [Rhodanobacteraceae bacterium]|nr:esterase-like activity of phytase family protein [Rhodanobacteraceae bacterium]
SVLADPVRGALTAPESPLLGGAADLHTLYATGQSWSFAQYAGNSRLKELARLPDGTVLVLERSRPGPSKDVYVASLRRLDIAACKTHRACPTTQLATLPAGPDNFEGMAVLDNRHLLIVSDNGDAPARGTTFELIGFAP